MVLKKVESATRISRTCDVFDQRARCRRRRGVRSPSVAGGFRGRVDIVCVPRSTAGTAAAAAASLVEFWLTNSPTTCASRRAIEYARDTPRMRRSSMRTTSRGARSHTLGRTFPTSVGSFRSSLRSTPGRTRPSTDVWTRCFAGSTTISARAGRDLSRVTDGPPASDDSTGPTVHASSHAAWEQFAQHVVDKANRVCRSDSGASSRSCASSR